MSGRKPKRATTWRTCPNCGSRATKIFSLNAKDKPLLCQICDHRYSPPERKGEAP
jgi:transcription elongation factor Elf1